VCDLHDQHEHESTTPNGQVLSRRRIMQLLGAAGVTTAVMTAEEDPVAAASADAAEGAYEVPEGLAEDGPAKTAAMLDRRGGPCAALAPIGTKMHTWSTAACAAAAPGQAAVVAAAKYLAATAVDLLTRPARLKALKDEFAERTKDVEWRTALPDGYEPPRYEPPAWFLKKTGQEWPPENITWPPKRVVSQEKFSSLGPALTPQK
jgi:hypothetical protein